MNLDFDDVADKVPTQELSIVQSREVGEYAVRCVNDITLCTKS